MKSHPAAAPRLLAAGLLVFAVSGVVALAAPPAGLNPKAPAETDQFSFLVGEWSCTTRWMQPDGTLADGPSATWTGYYILDGWAIQDDWVSLQPDGTFFHGTNVRSFNAESGRWDNRWLSQEGLWKYFSAERVGETMVMTGGEGRDGQGRSFVDRNVFYDLQADSWRWRKDRSFDGGASWIEGVGHIRATRAR